MHPLVPVLLSFASGLLASYEFKPGYPLVYAALLISFVLFFVFPAYRKRFSYLAVIPVFFSLGVLYFSPIQNPDLPENHIKNLIASDEDPSYGALGHAVEGVISSTPEIAGERTRFYIDSKKILAGGEWKDTVGKVLITAGGRLYGFKTGDTVRFISPLREPWNHGNPGEFDYKSWLNKRGIFVTGFVKNEKLFVKVSEGGFGIRRYVEGFRDRVRAGLDGAGLKNREALKALMIAEDDGIENDVKDALIKTGTWHIISISGLHIAVVTAFSYGFFLFLFKRSERLMLAFNVKKAALALSIIPAAAYGMAAGFPVPTQRAVIMIVAFALAFLTGRGKDFYNTLALAALFILVIYPYSIGDVSFQLSFAAIFSIAFIVPGLKQFFEKNDGVKEIIPPNPAWRWIKSRAMPIILVTVAAGVGTSPIVAYHFNRVSFTGLFANLFAVPLTGIIVPILFTASLVMEFWEGAARLMFLAADTVFEVMMVIVKFFASLPYSSALIPTPTIAGIILFYCLIFFAVKFRKGTLYKWGFAAAVLAMIVLAGARSFSNGPKDLEVTFISVGQGDSALVEFPDGKTMLIDGGGSYSSGFDTGERVIAPFLLSKGIIRLDYVVLSHSQLDHLGGLKYMAENFGVGEFWWNGDGTPYGIDRVFEKSGAKVKKMDASSGEFLIGGCKIEALHPSVGLNLDKNNMSLVVKITYGERSFLFTGDIGRDGEEAIIRAGTEIKADVLKAPHHGSKNSSAISFLQALSPGYVVVSAGRNNPFGFPHEETLGRYASIGAKVLRTDSDGAVTVRTDGRSIEASGYLTGREP